MQNLYKYYIHKDNNLLLEILKWIFDFSDYIKLKQSELEDSDYDPNFNFILNIRKIEDIASAKNIKEYIKDIKPIQAFSKKIKVAVITTTPTQVAAATLYNLFEDRLINYEIF